MGNFLASPTADFLRVDKHNLLTGFHTLKILHLSLFLGIYAFNKRVILSLSFYNGFHEEVEKFSPAFNSLSQLLYLSLLQLLY